MKRFIIVSLLGAALLVGGCGSNKVADLSTDQFKSALQDSNTVIVDTRGDSVYNGFASPGASRGGHVPHAIQFTTEWLDGIHPDKFESFAADKGITKDKTIVFYDDNADHLERVGAEFASRGYKVKTYSKFVDYANDKANQLESFPNYKMLVSAPWLKDVLDGKKPETYTGAPVKVFHVSWGPTEQAKGYKQHVTGAYHFNTDWIENEPVWNLSSPEVVRDNLLKQGITKDTMVVLYSENQLAAFRVMWALKWAGVEDVRILNGGVNAWINNEYPIDTTVHTPEPVTDFGAPVPSHPDIDIASAQDAYKAQQEGTKLVSIRSWDEYTGKVSGYDYIPKAGEPAGAIWGFAGTDASNVADYYDPDGSLRNPYEMFALWEGQGIHKGDKLAFYCGTGWRAGIPWFITEMAGWNNVKVYDGGWNAWQMDGTLPTLVIDPNTPKPNAKNDFGVTPKTGTSCKS